MWTLSVRPSRDSGLEPVDVMVRAQQGATVRELAGALGRHLCPQRTGLLVVPTEDGALWPAGRPLAECGLRSGMVLDVVTAPQSWAQRPGRPPRRRAILRVVAGPDAGLVVPLAGDSATIGRAPGCTVTLADPLVSRRHARVFLTAAPVVVDEGSAHGTSVDGTSVRRPTPVPWGTPIELGGSTVVLDPAEAGAGPAGTGVLRPPRFGEPLVEDTMELPAPPERPKPPMTPWAMLLMPLVFGAAMLVSFRSIYALFYIVGWPLAMFGGYYLQRRHQNKEFAEELALWRTDFEASLERLDRHNAAQRSRAFDDHPELAELPTRVMTRHPMLWTRRDTNDDFLHLRVGLGPVPAMLAGKLADGGDRQAATQARRELDLRRVLPDMPVCVPAADVGLIAIVGPRPEVDAAARAFVLRLCCDHSPADLSVAAVLGRSAAHHESWLRWLPQVHRLVGGAAPVASGAADGQALLDQLVVDESGRGETVCLVDEEAGVARRAVEAVAAVMAERLRRAAEPLAQAPAGRRLRLIWLGGDPHTVPSGTDVLIDLTASIPAQMATAAATRPGERPPRPVVEVAHRDRGGVRLVTRADTVELGTAWKVARAMTDFSDEAAVLPADTALPERVRLPEITGDLTDPDDEAPILERWSASRGLRAQIGMGVDGPVTLDLRDDGPHGLVAGTTGSGKSELLQSLICSLALNNPPDRMTFLLVDYKGGAAFRECADLPHTVGYITDLTPALVTRALTSLTAELNAREEILARYGAKDLIALERDHPDAAPPSLLICVDEFAALTAEVPNFVDGMVNIAQRGRSLGMHMLLATQRPAGVVTAQIRANTDLRIALRVSSTDDSHDVLDRSDAANISRRTPGRAWIRRTGHGTAELVQAAWVGAREEVRRAGELVDVLPFSACDLSGDEGYDPAATEATRLHPRTDLDRLVTTIGGAFVRSGRIPPRRPWLPPLQPHLLLGCSEPGELLVGVGAADEEQVPGASDDVVRIRVGEGQVPLGLADQPAQQSQPPLVLDYPQSGHVLVFGASGSGKTELLRTVAVSATLAATGLPPRVFAIDFAGGGLAGLRDWPSVGSVVGEQQVERVLRLLRMLRRTVTERNALLASSAATDLESLAAAGHPLPRVHVLIDNLPALTDALEGGGAAARPHEEMLAAVLQEGRRVGVHVTATTPRRGGVSGAMQAAFGERLVLRMTVDDDYMMLGVPTRVLTADSPPGRGLVGRGEFQVATLGGAGTAVQPERLRRLAELVADRFAGQPPVVVPAMPTLVPHTALPAPERDSMVLAVEARYVAGVSVALAEAPILVAGRGRSGRSSMLAGIAGLARRSTEPPAEIVLLGARAAEAPRRDLYDTVLDDLSAVAGWLPGWRERLAGAVTGDPSRRPWSLLLLDDAHLWEQGWDSGGATREALVALAELVSESPALNLAAVVAVDADEARSRGHIGGPVQAARRGRRGVLFAPDYADTNLLGVAMPMHTVEPLLGAGRGLWCSGGESQVVHVVSASAREEQP